MRLHFSQFLDVLYFRMTVAITRFLVFCNAYIF